MAIAFDVVCLTYRRSLPTRTPEYAITTGRYMSLHFDTAMSDALTAAWSWIRVTSGMSQYAEKNSTPFLDS